MQEHVSLHKYLHESLHKFLQFYCNSQALHFLMINCSMFIRESKWAPRLQTDLVGVIVQSPTLKEIDFTYFFIYLFGVLRHFQHCTGHITTGSWKGRGNQYIEFARVVYCKLPTNGKQLPAFPLKAITVIVPQPQRWEA